MEKALELILTELKEVRSDIHEIKHDVSTLKHDVQELKEGQEKLNRKMADIPIMFDKLEQSVGNELARHQEILNILSTRSIEQEGEIKGLKSVLLNR